MTLPLCVLGLTGFAGILQQDPTETKNPTSPSQPQSLFILSTQPGAWDKRSAISAKQPFFIHLDPEVELAMQNIINLHNCI